MISNEFLTAEYCACLNLRGASRVVTQAYDRLLEPSGLSITGFGVLVAIENGGPASINQLGTSLVMDPTTVNRHLKPLLKAKLVKSEPGDDHRVKLISLTPQGQEALAIAKPLWVQAQTRVAEGMGQARFENFIKDLHFAVDLLR